MTKNRRAPLWIGFAALIAIALMAVAQRPIGRRPATNESTPDAVIGDAPVRGQSPSSTPGHALAPERRAAPGPTNAVEGEPAHEQQTTPEQDAARALTRQRYEASLSSPNRLEWEPDEAHPSNMVFDLCDDEQAREAGLHEERLAEERRHLGVACGVSQDHRFGVIPKGGPMFFASSYREADDLLKEYAEEGSVRGEKFDKPIGILMG